ncbi:MAG: ABC transporter permease [Ferruginibacter sp.]
MLLSYFKIALRSFSKHRMTSFINIFGLGLSMSVGLMIMIRLQDQLSYDHFHPSPERTYRITSAYSKKNETKWKMASTPLPLMDAVVKDTNFIESVVNIYPSFNGKATANGKEIYIGGAFTEPSFFKIFGFTLSAGNVSTALQMPNTVVISKSTAEKYFGTNDVIGKVLTMENGSSFIITGVLNKPAGKSHLNFDAYASYSSVTQLEKDKILPEKLTDAFAFNAGYTYVLLKKGFTPSAFQPQLNAFAREMNVENKEGTSEFNLQPLSSITPGSSDLANNIGSGSSWEKIYFEVGMALLILLAACFNYTNLTIARALTRAKEVGVRKIVGANRSQVFGQYIFESVLLSMLALGFAWIILSLIVRYAPFNDGYEFIPSSFHYNFTYICCSITYALFTGLLAGSSPAWILSAFKPLRVLKNLSTARVMGKLGLQKTLIVFQYSLSLVILIFLFVFYKQFSFVATVDPGYKKDNVMLLPLNGYDENIATQKIAQVAGVKLISASSANFSKRFTGINAPAWVSNKKEATGLNYYYADEKFTSLLQLSFAAGKNFPIAAVNDNSEQYIILNETAAHFFGFQDSKKAIGQKLWINDSVQLEISGVLKDFIYENAGNPIRPLALRMKKNAYSYLYVQTEAGEKDVMQKRVLAAINTKASAPIFSTSWLADDLDKSNSQTATISLLGFLGFIALAIASLGLLGIVTYTVEVKGKEISVRKVLGASEKQLVKILSKGFVKLLMIAGVIAMPIGWLLATMFLQNFSIRVNFGFMNVVFCFLFLLGIGLFTIMSQTYKAASANPVKNLRNE